LDLKAIGEAAPLQRVEILDDRAGQPAGAGEPDELTLIELTLGAAFRGGVLALDEVADDGFELQIALYGGFGGHARIMA